MKLLILHASAGNGHRRAADALVAAAKPEFLAFLQTVRPPAP